MKKKLILILSSALLLDGCATINETYHSTSDAITSWFESDEKTDVKTTSIRTETPTAKSEENKTTNDMKIEELKK
jgi:PBP1b-binding outer membrane lipoprotein LpoB